MATEELRALWKTCFAGVSRPELYSSHIYNEDGFEPITHAPDFITSISGLDSQQLYAVASNNQLALQKAQAEYHELERQINQIKHKDLPSRPILKNPQQLMDHDAYEEHKESILYGYKFDPKRSIAPNANGGLPLHIKEISEAEKYDTRLNQDPWSQGGFVPSKRQYDSLRAKAKDSSNPDGWSPVERNGRRLVPRMYTETYDDQRERYGALALPIHVVQSSQLTNGSVGHGSDIEAGTRRGTPILVNKTLRSTRFNGAKVPQTRDTSEAPNPPVSRASTPKRRRGDTPLHTVEDGSPATKKARTNNDDVASPPKRKRHNQYTKAKELREQAAAVAAATAVAQQQNHTESPRRYNGLAVPNIPPPTPAQNQPSPTKATKEPEWMRMTADEKFAYRKWTEADLVAAAKADPSWLAGPLRDNEQLNLQIRDLIVAHRHPIRGYAAKRHWIEREIKGIKKRGPRQPKHDAREDDGTSDDPVTPDAESDTDHDELGSDTGYMSPGPPRAVNGASTAQNGETLDGSQDSKQTRRTTRKLG